jgi:CDP-glucose 4,6-dehydratase
MTPDFWHGKRVLLTGHTGFKGSWASLWLQSLGAELTGFALQPPTQPSLFEEAGIANHMRSIIGDIRDLPALVKTMQEYRPEIVIHMAAQALVRYSYQNPVETYSTNVMGTVNLLEAVRSTPGVRAVVNVTSDKCYENREWVWGYRESEPMGGRDPYSNSKGCAELLTSAYRSSYFRITQDPMNGVALATVRAGNIIGGGDWAKDRLVPDILTACQQRQRVVIRSPQSVRPWQHVLEPLRGYFTLAERLYEQGQHYAEAWNFGPNDEGVKPVAWIVERITKMWGDDASWRVDAGEHPHEAAYLKLDISKARSRLNWQPILRLEDVLALTVDWAKRRLAGVDVRKLTLAQVHDYQTLTKG